jgi:hypothetical protein
MTWKRKQSVQVRTIRQDRNLSLNARIVLVHGHERLTVVEKLGHDQARVFSRIFDLLVHVRELGLQPE